MATSEAVISLAPGAAPDFELAREIEVPAPELRSFLCDLHKMAPLHPFIQSIQDLPPREDLGKAKRYRVVDQIPMGPFKLKTVYRAALEPVAPLEVHGHAWQSPGVRLRTVYHLSESSGSGHPVSATQLVERCHVRAPRMMRRWVVAQARKAHSEMLDRMKTLLETG